MNRFVTLLFAVVFLAAAAQSQLQPQFFGMGVSTPGDMPKVSFGTIAHPPIAWTMIEGTGRGKFNFKSMDGFVTKAPKNAQGTALISIDLGGWTPEWAVTDHTTCYHNASGVGVCTVAPDNIQDWVDFVTAVIQHYNGVTAPHVAYYEIWNEASNTLFWTGTVAQMLAFAQTAYPIVKQDKFSMVLTPSVTWRNGLTFMTDYLEAGGGAFADGLVFHGYPSRTGPGTLKPVPMPESPLSTNAPIMTMISTFRALADSNGMQGKPLMTTEGGWGTNGVSDSDQQIAWITHYEILQAGLAASNNLLFQDWFTWGQAFSGTIENSSGQPTPAANAYNVVYGWLVNQMPQACSSSDSIIYTCVVGSNLIVWNAAQTCNNGVCTTSPYTPPLGYSKYVDVTNTTTTISGSIKLGLKPIMLKP